MNVVLTEVRPGLNWMARSTESWELLNSLMVGDQFTITLPDGSVAPTMDTNIAVVTAVVRKPFTDIGVNALQSYHSAAVQTKEGLAKELDAIYGEGQWGPDVALIFFRIISYETRKCTQCNWNHRKPGTNKCERHGLTVERPLS